MKNLKAQELACGKVQIKIIGTSKVELYKEHNQYHVRRFSDFIDGRKIQDTWLSFEFLCEARRCFRRQVEISEATK